MKAQIKSAKALLAIAVCFAATLICVAAMFGVFAYAENNDNVGTHYFYDELSEQGKKFYDVLDELKENGSFKDGRLMYNLVDNGIVTESETENYVVNKDYALPLAFSAARDAYLMDKPDLFYIDLYKIVFGAGKRDGRYTALLDTGNFDTLYFDGGFTSEQQVDAAITEYAAAVKSIADGARAAAPGSIVGRIEYVNKYLCDNTTYDYASYEHSVAAAENTAYAGNAYGALVKNLAVCGGYGRAFKAVMDELGIPCVCVQGYSLRPAGTVQELHLWNRVKADDKWYDVDVTWNDNIIEAKSAAAAGKAKAAGDEADAMRYLLAGANVIDKDHVADGVISTSGYELYYPKLNPYPYGVNENNDGFVIDEMYENVEVTGADDVSKYLYVTISYNGLGAGLLEKQGLYLAFRYSYNDAARNDKWTTTPWQQVTEFYDMWFGQGGTGNSEKALDIRDSYTRLMVTTVMDNVEFALINKPADGAVTPGYEDIGYIIPYNYDAANLDPANIFAVSETVSNDWFGTYTPKPHPVKTTPDYKAALSLGTYVISVTYDKSLVKIDPDADIGIDVVTAFDDMDRYIKVSDVTLSADGKTVSFKFTPSKMYHHNYADYNFYPTNLVADETGGKAPKGIAYRFVYQTSPVTPKVTYTCMKYGHSWTTGGYATSYGLPKLISDTDLSESGFEDIMGNKKEYGKDQRAQVILVASKPDADEIDTMSELLADGGTSGVKSAATYEIEMMVCQNKIKNIPNGYSLQLGVGFPGDFDYNDDSVVYKAYHYKRDAEGKIVGIEEVPCVVTDRGLVIDVKSFSPFMIVAIDANDPSAKSVGKTIYAVARDTVGGTVGALDGGTSRNAIVSVSGSITYAIAADAGYAIDKVLLNGVEIAAVRYADGKLTIAEDELGANNILDVSFVLKAAEERYKAENIEMERVPVIVIEPDATALKANAAAHDDAYVPTIEPEKFVVTSIAPTDGKKKDTALIIAVCMIVIVVIFVAGAATLLAIMHKKSSKKSGGGTGKQK